MTRTVHVIDVDRIVVDGVAAPVDGARLTPLVEAAVARTLAGSTLPPGRTMRASVRMESGAIASGSAPAIASAVAAGIARAVGGAHRG